NIGGHFRKLPRCARAYSYSSRITSIYGRSRVDMIPQKLYIKTYGCQMNEYDSSKIVDVLRKHLGITLTDIPEEANILLMNTCSIREKAQEKVFSDLGRWRTLKTLNPDVIIGVGGCVASQEGDAILRRAPYVDLVFGPQTLHRLPEMLAERQKTKKSVVDI